MPNQSTALGEFRRGLDDLMREMDDYENLRPFVCRGSPLSCPVFIVGINPASPLDSSFWDSFWSDESGFDYDSFIDLYKQRRLLRSQESGRKKREISPTRVKIDKIVTALGREYGCLETNLYPRATATPKELGEGDKRLTIFEFLLREIRPSILFIHGQEVREEIERVFGWKSTKDSFELVQWGDANLHLFAAKNHLSRGFNQDAEVYGQKLRERLRAEL